MIWGRLTATAGVPGERKGQKPDWDPLADGASSNRGSMKTQLLKTKLF